MHSNQSKSLKQWPSAMPVYRRIRSLELLYGVNEVIIEHGASEYSLKENAKGELVLRKQEKR